MKRSHLAFAIALAVPPLAAPQGGAVSGPVLGYAFQDGALRAIQGVPGAALLAAPAPLGFPAAVAETARDFALAVSSEDGLVRVVEFGTGAVRVVEGAAISPDRILLSPRATAALLVKNGASAAGVITGLPSAPAARDVDFSALPGPPGALAVSDDGSAVLASTSAGLFLVIAGETRPVPSAGPVSALAFLPGSRDALAAGSGGVALLSNLSAEPAIRTLATFDEEFGEPLATAAAGGRALVAGSRAVAVVDLASGQRDTLRCSCEVTALAPLAGDAFRITPASAETLWIVSGGPEARLLFVPPAKAEEEVR